MCLICVDFQKERMTITDARRALREMITTLEPEHARQVHQMIQDAERQQRVQEAARPSSTPSTPQAKCADD